MSRCDGFEDIYGVCLYISVMASKETFLLLLRSVVDDDLLSSSAFRFLSLASPFPFPLLFTAQQNDSALWHCPGKCDRLMYISELIPPCIATLAVSSLFDFFSCSLPSLHCGHRLVLAKLRDHDN